MAKLLSLDELRADGDLAAARRILVECDPRDDDQAELATLVDSLPAGPPPAERLLVERAHEFAARQHAEIGRAHV